MAPVIFDASLNFCSRKIAAKMLAHITKSSAHTSSGEISVGLPAKIIQSFSNISSPKFQDLQIIGLYPKKVTAFQDFFSRFYGISGVLGSILWHRHKATVVTLFACRSSAFGGRFAQLHDGPGFSQTQRFFSLPQVKFLFHYNFHQALITINYIIFYVI